MGFEYEYVDLNVPHVFVPQVTYKTPVPTGEVYFSETFDDGSLDRYDMLLKMRRKSLMLAEIHDSPTVLSDQDKLAESAGVV